MQMTSTNIYFVRHALPDYSWTNDEIMPLTKTGENDSIEVLNVLKNIKFDFCISSPYKRTLQTIEPLALYKKLAIHTDKRLKERLRGEVGSNEAGLLKQRWQDFSFHENDGESMDSLQKRNVAALREILTSHRNENILFATHGAALSSILNYLNPNFGYLDFIRLQCFTPYVLKVSFNQNNQVLHKEEILIMDKA
ncbi:MAG: histidine phosphatase family protein [Lentilactobacillus hilgardii]|uniref:histidine phosphatase family protein n=1 Tax=Lactobacillaceae TaxID=33958 RepID=UPI0010B2D089|nr:hypothetical protein OAL24_00863 [Oenococcus sicerae]